jgi:hypothetical protein
MGAPRSLRAWKGCLPEPRRVETLGYALARLIHPLSMRAGPERGEIGPCVRPTGVQGAVMGRTWYRRLFPHAPQLNVGALLAKAESGDRDAQFGLGIQLSAGLGALRDPVQAAHWYRLAADQNHALAQFNLGLMYADGDGVPRDLAESAAWIERAADQGDAGAQHCLGVRCQRASFEGAAAAVGESRIEAYKWFHLAAAQGYRGSELACEGINLKMTREQIVEGNRRAAAFQVQVARFCPA